ncbi:MAG: proton-conducting transporter membrane subunit [Marinobacter sp.]|uniref:proton-conducting transporter transmembrane domain-containing protein n=1 Tax=Marinobacter sp. TaxID=50741 RepID=UPI00299EE6FA|nr:proton-conducting transporter membrane subunit [Marinobacter sp.]MDX1634082.1 proton-conducting transporter membrane subunit [Marinobacter sp.]
MSAYLLPYLPPAVLMLAALAAFTLSPRKVRFSARLAEASALLAFLLSLLSGLALLIYGPGNSPLLGGAGVGFSARIDVVSAIMLLLVSFVGWIVLRYSATYLRGEPRQGIFTGWMCATLVAVLLLVQAGNLLQLIVAWVAIGVFLHRLLLFYPDRVPAQRAARKKALTGWIGNLSLLGAGLLLVAGFGTGDIAAIAEAIRAGNIPMATPWAAALITVAALMKSAQFPVHSWLTEVMETPTPVSALLHAGVINAGGFLLIRLADVMLVAPGMLAVLVMVGGFTALFGGLVMLTQPTVKTSLAWSTIGQMGFMILQCGLGLFPIALLHIVAHSLYKAHAFLSSGGAVEQVTKLRRPGPIAIPDGGAVGKAFLVALLLYGAIGAVFGFEGKSPQAIALGAVLILGVAYLLAQGLADAAPRTLTRRTAIYSVLAGVGYFALQTGAEWLTRGTLPPTPEPRPLEWALVILTVVSFGLVAVAQAMFPLWAYHPAAAGLRVHLSNGLYINALFDRFLKGWAVRSKPGKTGAESSQ